MGDPIIIGNRRFTCLSPTLVRMEFAPDGVFEKRRSLVAHAKREPIAFIKIQKGKNDILLETGKMTVITRENDKAFFPANLETRWIHDGLLQYWRPGDRDYRNLGGTVRSLDGFGNLTKIQGVHTADMESPNTKGNEWLTWIRDEEDPYYYKHSPDKRPGFNGDFHATVRFNLPHMLSRTRNYTMDHLHYGPGVLSRSGYFFLNDSVSPVMDPDDFPVERIRPGYQDWYFFAYGHDFKTALADFIRLTGRASLPTKNTFGLVFSRWPAYDETEAKQIIEEFRKHGIPLSTLVIDMEWHKEGWGHWEWNDKWYPDPAAFFRWCHEQGLQVTLNDHPLDVRADDAHFKPYLKKAGTAPRVRHTMYNKKAMDMIDVDIGNKREAMALLEVCHKAIIQQGMDFWWNDGCKGRLNGAINQLVANKLFFEEVQSETNRGMLLSRYGGLGSHRYGVIFTGDTLSCWEVLATQCEFNIRAGHLGLAYVSHDIGGFFMTTQAPLLDPALYLRWLQFGIFSPVIRFHSAPGCGSRKPWDYGETISKAAQRWLKVRNSLTPYLYTAARVHYDTAIPIIQGLFLNAPNDESAYRFDEYYFGPSLLVAPVLSAENYRQVYLPPGEWYRFETNERVTGGQELTVATGLDNIPVYVKAGSIVVRQTPEAPPMAAHIQDLLLDVYPGGDSEAELYEDDGRSSQFKRGAFCRSIFILRKDKGALTLSGKVSKGKPQGKTRQIIITISLDHAPKTVLLNRRQRVACEALDTAKRYRIRLPELPANRPFEITIQSG